MDIATRQAAARAIVIAAMLFNAGLAIVNANIASMNPAIVIGCEATLTAAAAALGLRGNLPLRQCWLALAALIAVFGVANAFGSGSFDPKLIRDVLLVPVFVLLGLSCDRADLIRVVIPLQIVVLAVMLFEAVRPEDFGHYLNVMSYYINTRGFQTESFWNGDSDLFVSATRPGERFLFNGLNIHRLSSVFLEPVSLGNYCVLVALIAGALWASLSLRQRLFLLVSEFLILVGCDGRFATVCIVLILALRFVAPRLPRFVNWVYLPGVLGLSAIAVSVLALSPEGDDFPSRTAGSIYALARMSGTDLLGYATPRAYTVMDSGIAYLLYSQSLIGALVIWSFIALGLPQRDRVTAVMAHGVSLYFALNLLISYSVFSIKTSALLWFSYGAMVRPAAQALLRRPGPYRAGARLPLLLRRGGQPA